MLYYEQLKGAVTMLYGVDVSEWQGTIDWDALNTVSNFVMIRASFGTARKDNQFDRNQSEARRVQASAGPLGIGYYYYAYAALLDPIISANYFVDNLGFLQEGEVLALDLEGDLGSSPVEWALSFLKQVETRTNVKAIVYLNQSEISSYDWSPVINAGYGLWVANYNGDKEALPGVNPWPVTAMRQWTNMDQIAGISTQVDGDTFYGDISAWNAYGYHVSPAPVVEPVVPTEPPANSETLPVSTEPELPVNPATTPVPTPTPPEPTQLDPSTPPVIDTTPITHTGLTFIEDIEDTVSWFGTTQGLVLLQAVGAFVGYLTLHFGVDAPSWLATLLGYATGTVVHVYKNPSTPNR